MQSDKYRVVGSSQGWCYSDGYRVVADADALRGIGPIRTDTGSGEPQVSQQIGRFL